jgi:hypothetical protein
MPSLGAGTVVEVVGEIVVLAPGRGGTIVGTAFEAECPEGEVATEAIPAPVARRTRVTTTIHELALPGLCIAPLADSVILTHVGRVRAVGTVPRFPIGSDDSGARFQIPIPTPFRGAEERNTNREDRE